MENVLHQNGIPNEGDNSDGIYARPVRISHLIAKRMMKDATTTISCHSIIPSRFHRPFRRKKTNVLQAGLIVVQGR